MLERNKSIFRLLLAITVVEAVIGMVLSVLYCKTLPDRWLSPLLIMVINAVFVFAFVLVIRHPNHNRNYVVKMINGRPQLHRKVYAPDPQGWRYLSGGIAMVLLSLLVDFTVLVDNLYGGEPTVWMTVVIVLLIALILAVMGIVEYKLDKDNK